MKKISIIIVCIITFLGCIKQKETGSVSIPIMSKDDKVLYFQYHDGYKMGIFKLYIGDSITIPIVSDSNDIWYCYPKTLNNKDMNLMFKRWDSQTGVNTIYIADKDGNNRKALFSDVGIYDFYYQESTNSIIYNKSDTISRYSPLARKGPHGFDLYEYNIATNQTHKLSNYYSYEMGEIAAYKNNEVMFVNNDKEEGIYAFSPDSSFFKPHTIAEDNEKKEITYLYTSPIYIKKYDIIIFRNGYYNFFKIDKNGKIEEIYSSDGKQISSFCVYNTQDRILFTMNDDTNFYSIKFDGTDKRIIKVKLPEKIN